MRNACTGLGLLVCLFGSTISAYAGQSIRISSSLINNVTIPALAAGSACRIELSFHDWDDDPPPYAHPWDVPACGFDLTLYNFGQGDIRLQIYSSQHQNATVCMIRLGLDANGVAMLPSKFATVRFQRIPTTDSRPLAGDGGVEYCEATDINGKTFWTESHVYTGINSPLLAGVTIGGTATYGLTISTAYLRLFSTTAPLGSRPPVTADKGDLLEWKFDGNTDDSSGHGYTAQLLSGLQASYVKTPGQDLVVAILNTKDSPGWSTWTSLRAGTENQLDCSNSYSQSDISADVTCAWLLSDGPTSPTWSSTSAQQPTVTGLSAGTYTFQLTITDASNVTATTKTSIGAVMYDDNGVVIPSDPKIGEIFGPMIAFGQNPWGYADERAKRMVELQNAYFMSQHWDHPTWETSGQGTVSYPFSGKGPGPGQSCTRLTGDINASDRSIAVEDASCLSLSTLPTWILIGSNFSAYGGGGQEMVRICSTTATSGPATLTACYDGRGIADYAAASASIAPAQAWPASTIVGEYKLTGTGTAFAADANRPLCPAGIPGPPGPVTYSAGMVRLTAGSNIVTGLDTNWTVGNGAIGGYSIRVQATHNGGDPFIWWAQITTVNDVATITASRPAPADVDTNTNFSYKITGLLYLSLEFTAPDGSTARSLQNLKGCESDSSAFALAGHDIPALNTTTFSGAHYSYKDALGAQSAFGPNFYGSGLAARAFYFRSGWDFAKQTADLMDEHWVNDPELCNGWCGGIPLLQGGGVVGAIADLVTNPSTSLTWNSIRTFVASGLIGSSGCNAFDTRESGYISAWVALAANYDPDDTKQAYWKDQLAAIMSRDGRCKQPDNSWSNGFLFNSSSPSLTVIPGSPLVTGDHIPASLCFGIASGSVTVLHGSAILIGTGLVKGNKMVITATRDGQPYVGTFEFTQSDGIAGTLAALWPGDSGTFSYTIENNDFLSTIGTSGDDPQLTKNWACTWNSPSQITLNRPWDGPFTSNAHLYSYVLAGFGQQPFMLGIKITQMKLGSQNRDSDIANGYAKLAALAATWIHDTGFDPVTQGLFYGRVFEACEPTSIPTPGTVFSTRTPGCNFSLDPSSLRAARVDAAEASQALRVYYEADPSQDRRDWGDLVYGSIWGYCPYTKAGYYCDSNYVRDENSDASLAGYKWPGFFFGMGMAHQWPAVREEGVPSRIRRR